MAKKTRTHLPQLSTDRLTILFQNIDKSRLSAAGKRAVKASLKAAQNPNAEAPDVIIASLPKERRASVMAHAAEWVVFSQTMTQRGKDRLLAMDAAEWDKLIEDANNE